MSSSVRSLLKSFATLTLLMLGLNSYAQFHQSNQIIRHVNYNIQGNTQLDLQQVMGVALSANQIQSIQVSGFSQSQIGMRINLRVGGRTVGPSSEINQFNQVAFLTPTQGGFGPIELMITGRGVIQTIQVQLFGGQASGPQHIRVPINQRITMPMGRVEVLSRLNHQARGISLNRLEVEAQALNHSAQVSIFINNQQVGFPQTISRMRNTLRFDAGAFRQARIGMEIYSIEIRTQGAVDINSFAIRGVFTPSHLGPIHGGGHGGGFGGNNGGGWGNGGWH
jgi:uncharacterized protein YbjQ (UPF0145 family)